MSSLVNKQLINSAINKDKLNILTFNNNGFWEYELSKLGHQYFYAKTSTFPEVKIPNFYPLNSNSSHVQYDLVLCNRPLANFDNAVNISHQLHIPLIIYEHCLPPETMAKDKILVYKNKIGQYKVIFPNDEIAQAWKFKPGEYFVSDYNVEQQPTNSCVREKNYIYGMYSGENDNNILAGFLGNIKGLEVFNFTETIESALCKCDCYIKLNCDMDIPYDILKAMAYGCIVITNENDWTRKNIVHGVNGLIFSEIKQFKNAIENGIDNKEKIRAGAIEYIANRPNNFNVFIDEINKTSKEIYIK
jgi:hypothetical protein